MVIGNGVYSGTIASNSKARNGYGRYETNDGSVYEGDWNNDQLVYGTRTTKSSVYKGNFDADLKNDGFGIIEYTDYYIEGKRSQGLADSEIIRTYVGNWRNNTKQGLGRSMKCDESIEFGHYAEGVLEPVPDANYRIGGSVYGIDLSHHQKDKAIDWNNLALFCDRNGNVFSNAPSSKRYMQPVFFAYMKATEGATTKDATFSAKMLEAERHGIVKGAYHYLHLNVSIDDQLKNFLETATWTPGDMPPALDVEEEQEIRDYGTDALQSMALKWLETVEKKMGVRPVIYTREPIRNRYFNDSRFKKYQFWIARYNTKGPDNFDWQIWQKSDNGRVNGYKKAVDINLFKGDYGSFKKFLEL
ncbi:MAG: hypothetical protein IJT30_11035 [Muribaculaceae bacterium]|nr:hypothetical protein [Muribaculaceae bacterium]